jgi:hypothetical protein
MATERAHYVTDGTVYSFCIASGQDDVFVHGDTVTTGPQPNDYCSGCGAVEPHWEHVEDEQMFRILKSN